MNETVGINWESECKSLTEKIARQQEEFNCEIARIQEEHQQAIKRFQDALNDYSKITEELNTENKLLKAKLEIVELIFGK